MILALGFAAGLFVGAMLTDLCALYFCGLLRADMARQLEGYGGLFLFGPRAARERDDRLY